MGWVREEVVQVPGLSGSSCPRSLKVEYDKLANEKTEMQRHYVMVRGGPGRGAEGRAQTLSGRSWDLRRQEPSPHRGPAAG